MNHRVAICLRAVTAAFALSAFVACRPPHMGTLDMYFIDVEGGQSTLVVTAAGESLLIDAGFPGTGTFASVAGTPQSARDAQRVLAAAEDAGISSIDYLLVTHYHADHAGGIPEVAQLLPITTFIDHTAPPQETEIWVPGTQAVYSAYLAVRAKGRHLQPKPGDSIPLAGIGAVICCHRWPDDQRAARGCGCGSRSRCWFGTHQLHRGRGAGGRRIRKSALNRHQINVWQIPLS